VRPFWWPRTLQRMLWFTAAVTLPAVVAPVYNELDFFWALFVSAYRPVSSEIFADLCCGLLQSRHLDGSLRQRDREDAMSDLRLHRGVIESGAKSQPETVIALRILEM
jgi:hypothetical protein